jgi:hypothetical protein
VRCPNKAASLVRSASGRSGLGEDATLLCRCAALGSNNTTSTDPELLSYTIRDFGSVAPTGIDAATLLHGCLFALRPSWYANAGSSKQKWLANELSSADSQRPMTNKALFCSWAYSSTLGTRNTNVHPKTTFLSSLLVESTHASTPILPLALRRVEAKN